MATLAIAWIIAIVAAIAANWVKGSWAYALPAVGAVLLAVGHNAPAGIKLLAASLLLLYLFKGAALAQMSGQLKGLMLPIYSLVWPGMDPESFNQRMEPAADSGSRFVRGLLSMYLGLSLVLIAALVPMPEWVRPWIGIAAPHRGPLRHLEYADLDSANGRLFGQAFIRAPARQSLPKRLLDPSLESGLRRDEPPPLHAQVNRKVGPTQRRLSRLRHLRRAP